MKTQLLLLFMLITSFLSAQRLQPKFDKYEYIEMLKIIRMAHTPRGDSVPRLRIRSEYLALAQESTMPEPQDYRFAYRTPLVAFHNGGDLWIHQSKPIAVIVIRGTIPTETSFLANAYAAMLPAIGEINLQNDSVFHYKLASDSMAAVHAGYLIATAHLASYFVHQIDSCYKNGIKDFIITGHSQGGGISYLLTAYLKNLQLDEKLPQDIQIKTYCSAAPKPGNLFFAYDFELASAGGWAYSVVNIDDWVTDVPFTIQTVEDLPEENPFKYRKVILKDEKLSKKSVVRIFYNQLDRPSQFAQRRYNRYLGKVVSIAVKKKISGFKSPKDYRSTYYVRTGNIIVLRGDAAYYERFKNLDPMFAVWQHRMLSNYIYLTLKSPY